ncbi:MAG TPA: hypothetical protein P5318_17785 [Candidatus Hydrogenedentes bacterium]|nr:hypothetical protein [Candidatus Hydrogenedentota bacterium]HRT21971.1 hypothetical protein [Candidatus Hydrogenedentota bacterium]HRT66671.1 hypothetical protein [Candidatus Hydrogenedentota bacterium]
MNAEHGDRKWAVLSCLAAGLTVFLACGYLYVHASRAASGVAWTDNFDSLRDVGMAHAILNGRYPEDPAYAGETLWYNPLIAACVAFGSWATGADPVDADIRLGPLLNLLVPAAFFVLSAYWFGPWVALAGTAYLLFGRPATKPVWMAATYSPTLLAGNFTLSLFFLTLLAYTRFLRVGGMRWRMITGVLWGTTFIGHTAPAVVLGFVLTLSEAVRWHGLSRQGALWRGIREYAGMILVAFTASLPYTYSIIWNYRFHILNSWPTRYTDPYIELKRLPAFLRECMTPSTFFAAIGLLLLLRGLRRRAENRMAVLWWAGGIGFLAYSYMVQIVNENWQVYIGQIVPGHHAMLFISAAKALLLGCGIVTGTSGILSAAYDALSMENSMRSRRGLLHFGGGVAAFAAFAVLAAGYREGSEYGVMKYSESFRAAHGDTRAVYDWITTNTKPDDAFLCEWDVAARLINATGRKLVANMIWYSNLYVDFQQRIEEKNAMFDALKNRDEKTFRQLAGKRNVRFVLLQKRECLSDPNGHEIASEACDALGLPFIERVFVAGRYSVYRVRDG